MRRSWMWVVGLVVVAFVATPAFPEDKRRNPFDVEDVKDPTADDIKEFAKGVTLAGDKDDKNAEQWVKEETKGKAGSLEGDWSGRWSGGNGTAQVKVVKDRVYVLYSDCSAKWLLEAVRDGKKLTGRWVNTTNPCDTGGFVGLIVDDERIDGAWSSDSRWDFRRKLKK